MGDDASARHWKQPANAPLAPGAQPEERVRSSGLERPALQAFGRKELGPAKRFAQPDATGIDAAAKARFGGWWALGVGDGSGVEPLEPPPHAQHISFELKS